MARPGLRDGPSRLRPARVPLRGQRGGGHPIVPEVVAAARALIEGTRLSFKAIGVLTGVSRTTLCRWCKRNRWERPGTGEAPARPTRYRRGRGRPYAGDAVGRARDLLTRTLLPQKAIAGQVGVSQAQISAWLRTRGWARPSGPPPVGAARLGASSWPNPGASRFGGSKRFAAAGRHAPLAAEGDRRGRPYAPAIRAEARVLWELTRLPTALIGPRLGVHPGTVARWAREDAWERPHGRAGARQLRGFFGSQRRRG